MGGNKKQNFLSAARGDQNFPVLQGKKQFCIFPFLTCKNPKLPPSAAKSSLVLHKFSTLGGVDFWPSEGGSPPHPAPWPLAMYGARTF